MLPAKASARLKARGALPRLNTMRLPHPLPMVNKQSVKASSPQLAKGGDSQRKLLDMATACVADEGILAALERANGEFRGMVAAVTEGETVKLLGFRDRDV